MKRKRILVGLFGLLSLTLLLAACGSRLPVGDASDFVGDYRDAVDNPDAREFCAEKVTSGLIAMVLFRDDLQSILADQEILSGEELGQRLNEAISEVVWTGRRDDPLQYSRYGTLILGSIIGSSSESIAGKRYDSPCGDFYVRIASYEFYHSMGWIESALAIAEESPDAAFALIQIVLHDDPAIFRKTFSRSIHALILSNFFSSQLLASQINTKGLSEDTEQWLQRLIEKQRTFMEENNFNYWDSWYEKR